MIQKQTYLVPLDKCGVWWVCAFHLYYGFSRKISYTGEFVKVSIKITKPQNFLKKKGKVKGILIRTQKFFYKNDKSSLHFFSNNVVLLKKRLTPRGKELFGPTLYNIKRKKFLMSFSNSI